MYFLKNDDSHMVSDAWRSSHSHLALAAFSMGSSSSSLQGQDEPRGGTRLGAVSAALWLC